MNNKEALHDLFTEANRLQSDKYHFNTKELFDRFSLIEQDLELLDALLKDIRVEYCGNQEEYIINSCYNKKSKIYQLLEKHFK